MSQQHGGAAREHQPAAGEEQGQEHRVEVVEAARRADAELAAEPLGQEHPDLGDLVDREHQEDQGRELPERSPVAQVDGSRHLGHALLVKRSIKERLWMAMVPPVPQDDGTIDRVPSLASRAPRGG